MNRKVHFYSKDIATILCFGYVWTVMLTGAEHYHWLRRHGWHITTNPEEVTCAACFKALARVTVKSLTPERVGIRSVGQAFLNVKQEVYDNLNASSFIVPRKSKAPL